MEFLGIGPLEVLFIALIALIVLGPKEMMQAAQSIGRFLRKVLTSSGWREFRRGVQSVKNLPYSMAREAGLEEDIRTISQATRLDVPNLSLPLDTEHTLKTIDQLLEADTSMLKEQEIIISSPSSTPTTALEQKSSDSQNTEQNHSSETDAIANEEQQTFK